MTDLRLGVLGGTFNPIHNGHLLLAKGVFEKLKLNKLIFLPTYQAKHKVGVAENFFSRVEMISIAIGSQEKFSVDVQEIFLNQSSYTYHSLRMLRKKYIDATLFFIIGADSYNSLHTWYRWNELFSLTCFIVVNRGDESPYNDYIDSNVNYLKNITKIDLCIPNISSSKIRSLIAQGKKVTNLLPREVEEYIYINELYKK
jgi:nicotinate-nucleotide adenylyltransferase